MDKAEFAVIAELLKRAYGAERVLPDKGMMDVWYGFLKDFDCPVMQAAATEYIATNKFPPTIAELREIATGVTARTPLPWDAAWGSVLKAIRQFGHYQELEALESMDTVTRMIVRRMGFQNICLAENIETERANFRMAYENEAKFQRRENLLPGTLKNEKLELSKKYVEKLADRLAWKEEITDGGNTRPATKADGESDRRRSAAD